MQHIVCLHAISCVHQNPLKTKKIYGSYPKKIIYRNSEYEVHQVGPKNTESQNLSFLAIEGEAASVTQICVQLRVTDGKIFFAQIMFLSHKSPKT
jgi:hypothetical protein